MSLTDEDKTWISEQLEEVEKRMLRGFRYFSYMYPCPFCRQQFLAKDIRVHLPACPRRRRIKAMR